MPQTDHKFKPSKLEVHLNGLIQAVEQVKSDRGDFYASTIVIPAPNVTTNPKRITVYSQMPIGGEDTVIDQPFYLRSTFKNRQGRWFNTLSLWDTPATN